MTNVSIKIEGLDSFIDAMRKSPEIVGRHLQRSLTRAAYQFLRETREVIRTGKEMWKAPIDTGFMWNNIYTSIYPLRAEVEPIASYAVYVHEGTTRMRARPFLQITEKYAKDDIENIFEDGLKEAMNEVAGRA